MRRFILVFIILLLLTINVNAEEEFGLGIIENDESYATVPLIPPLSKGFEVVFVLPTEISLKEYAPIPGNQNPTNSCGGWSMAYGAMTIIESISKNRTDPQINKDEAFSPSYIYNQINPPNNNNCDDGMMIEEGLEIMCVQGIAKLSEFPFDCSKKVTSEDKQNAKHHKIRDYVRLFKVNNNKKVNTVKQNLAAKRPVIIAMECYSSFNKVADVWNPPANDNYRGLHAMVVIGYDDDKYGGAFELMNSWGTNWGNDGFTWIRYDDFNQSCRYAYAIIEEMPPGQPLEGNLSFQKTNGDEMKATFRNGIYYIDEVCPVGTSFRFYITNNKPAYVYAFGTDLKGDNTAIFPYDENMSPYFVYSDSKIAIPSENHYIKITPGAKTDYMCVLYSKRKLSKMDKFSKLDNDIEVLEYIMQEMENQKGTFDKRLDKILGKYLVKSKNIKYEDDISFSAIEISKNKYIVPIIIEFKH